jgi:predicted Zn-dependent protease
MAHQKYLIDVQPLVQLALARLRLIQEGLNDLEKAIARDERSVVIGGLVMAQDHLGPMTTLVDAAILLAKEVPHESTDAEKKQIARQELSRRIIARWRKSVYGNGALSDDAMRLLADMAITAITET